MIFVRGSSSAQTSLQPLSPKRTFLPFCLRLFCCVPNSQRGNFCFDRVVDRGTGAHWKLGPVTSHGARTVASNNFTRVLPRFVAFSLPTLWHFFLNFWQPLWSPQRLTNPWQFSSRSQQSKFTRYKHGFGMDRETQFSAREFFRQVNQLGGKEERWTRSGSVHRRQRTNPRQRRAEPPWAGKLRERSAQNRNPKRFVRSTMRLPFMRLSARYRNRLIGLGQPPRKEGHPIGWKHSTAQGFSGVFF